MEKEQKKTKADDTGSLSSNIAVARLLQRFLGLYVFSIQDTDIRNAKANCVGHFNGFCQHVFC